VTVAKVAVALAGVVLIGLLLAEPAHAWTPATHIYLGQTMLDHLAMLPGPVADLLRAFPYDYLYGNIAADSSIAKNYAPVSRHCHHWHVGQEIHDHARSDALRAFGYGYLSHLAADVIAHNNFVPRQLTLTSSTPSVGHAYWESRFESHLGDQYSRQAKAIVRMDHAAADELLDERISPTIFSVRTNRRLFKGMVHLTENPGWQMAFRVAREQSRWDLTDEDLELHMAWSFDLIVDVLSGTNALARHSDPAGAQALGRAKSMRKEGMRVGGARDPQKLLQLTEQHFGLGRLELGYWQDSTAKLPWREEVPHRVAI